jgi:hypothetical protein
MEAVAINWVHFVLRNQFIYYSLIVCVEEMWLFSIMSLDY